MFHMIYYLCSSEFGFLLMIFFIENLFLNKQFVKKKACNIILLNTDISLILTIVNIYFLSFLKVTKRK